MIIIKIKKLSCGIVVLLLALANIAFADALLQSRAVIPSHHPYQPVIDLCK